MRLASFLVQVYVGGNSCGRSVRIVGCAIIGRTSQDGDHVLCTSIAVTLIRYCSTSTAVVTLVQRRTLPRPETDRHGGGGGVGGLK